MVAMRAGAFALCLVIGSLALPAVADAHPGARSVMDVAPSPPDLEDLIDRNLSHLPQRYGCLS